MSASFMKMCDRRKLQDARDAVTFAQGKLERTIRELFPVGGEISWISKSHVQDGHVIRHGYGDDLFVRNSRTCKEVKFTSWHVLEAIMMEGART